ncbi:hypothetical protein SAMN05216238_101339 [Lentibacillus persicus]|uniref:Uncharacterized protein n=1 Tax=Lentibacillus persicus TaxID=640948 RepID=A0A1I1SBH9_9BACI|nr:hypothetical protein [Lentibacillus persicus]SFD43841.1 hypothetical protein SAMN05216238_101339 [Lentibacillus persicus]
MAFAIFFFLAWFFISLFAVMQKRLSIVENTFVFLIILIISINFSWIVGDELKLIKQPEEPLPYIAYLLNRSIIIPVLILIQLKVFVRYDTFLWKTASILVAVLMLTDINYLLTALNVAEYTHWHSAFDAIYFLLLNLAALFAYRMINRASEKAVNST